MPIGVQLDGNTGVISGNAMEWGTFDFTVKVEDSAPLSNVDTQAYTLNVIKNDSDDDGLPDPLEYTTCTDPNNADTDGDGIFDGVEDVNLNGVVDLNETDPCNIDTDGDGLIDGAEDVNHNGVIDQGETDPLNLDTDGDKMPDGWEVLNNLDPLVDDAQADADGDGYSNLEESQRRTDPNDPASHPVRAMPWLPLLLDD